MESLSGLYELVAFNAGLFAASPARTAFAAAAGLLLVVGFAAHRLGVRHKEAQARRLRERLVGRLNSRAP